MVDKQFLLVIQSSGIGDGTIDLSEKLMNSFFKTLSESDSFPSKIIFLNTGVFLTSANSPVLEELRKLEELGVEMISCTTCLKYFNRMEELSIGKAGNMKETVSSIANYAKVVAL